MKSNVNNRHVRVNTKSLKTIGISLLLVFVIIIIGPPSYPFPISKKLPGKPPVNKPLPSATVIYNDIINEV